MMERDFYNDEFEELLKQKTDQYKMYPSEKVWKGIYNSVHTRRKRFIVGMSVLITGIVLLAGKELLMPSPQPAPVRKGFGLALSDIRNQAGEITPAEPALKELKIPSPPQQLVLPEEENALSGNLAPKFITIAPAVALDPLTDAAVYSASIAANSAITGPQGSTAGERGIRLVENIPLVSAADHGSADIAGIATAPNGSENNVEIAPELLLNKETIEDKKNRNWLQSNASFELKKPVKRGRYNWQAYFSPTVNYRSLSAVDNSGTPKTGIQYVPIALTHLGNPNDYVNHKPAMGYEAGGSMLYRVTRNLTLKAGLQFNYSSYSIRAYSSSRSQQATIALNSFLGYYGNTITAYSNIQNFGGNSQKDLYNRYFQLSAPLGFEMRIMGNNRLQLHVAATVQPTYLLNRNSYLLTTDYSDYTREPSLFRRWNVNGAVEAFLSYRVGGLRWQIGPQLRYQFLSTYSDQYPIRENLKEYGIKIGVSKTIW